MHTRVYNENHPYVRPSSMKKGDWTVLYYSQLSENMSATSVYVYLQICKVYQPFPVIKYKYI